MYLINIYYKLYIGIHHRILLNHTQWWQGLAATKKACFRHITGYFSLFSVESIKHSNKGFNIDFFCTHAVDCQM